MAGCVRRAHVLLRRRRPSDTVGDVCENEDSRVVKLPCGHTFRKGCLNEWFETNDRSNADSLHRMVELYGGIGTVHRTCPTCRAPVKRPEVERSSQGDLSLRNDTFGLAGFLTIIFISSTFIWMVYLVVD